MTVQASHRTTPVHLIIPTHTTRHLEMCLVGAARQTTTPATVTVTCDVDDPAIEALLRDWSARLSMPVRYVHRPGGDTERLAQVRNNAVRALLDAGAEKDSRLLFLDGDTFASPDCIAKHARLGEQADMVLASRVNLSKQETAELDPMSIFSERTPPPSATEHHRNELNRQHRRALWHQRFRPLGLAKKHKPRLLGGHHSVTLARYLEVNGHDEEYHTWGTEDDDFARRVYSVGGTAVIAIRDIIVFHLYHPTRAPGDWHDRPNARRFHRRDLPVRARFGLDNPFHQAPVQMDFFGAQQAISAP